MENKIPLQILNRLLEINADRILIYSLVKNEIIYDDLKVNLDSCIKSSLLFKAQLEKEIDRLVSKENYETFENQEFFNVWLIINEDLSRHKREMINSLFTKSENVYETTYLNALKKDNLKHLSLRHRNLISKQKELLSAC